MRGKEVGKEYRKERVKGGWTMGLEESLEGTTGKSDVRMGEGPRSSLKTEERWGEIRAVGEGREERRGIGRGGGWLG
jgi:hypothetical protein